MGSDCSRILGGVEDRATVETPPDSMVRILASLIARAVLNVIPLRPVAFHAIKMLFERGARCWRRRWTGSFCHE